jgi:flagellar basal-body rod protein FlgF
MNRGIYATATGMMSAQAQLDVLTNNLANVSTTGFKRDGLAFAESFERRLRAHSGAGPEIGTLGSGAAQVAQFTIFEPGALTATGNPLDVAIQSPKGLFAVRAEGGVQYTRNGSFRLNESRQLVTQQGYPVLDGRLAPITLPDGKSAIQDDGTVLVDGQEVGQIGLFEGTFAKAGENLFDATDARAVETPELKAGHLEGSNVNAIEAMVGMISLHRSFELAQRSIQQQDDLTQRLLQSLQDR